MNLSLNPFFARCFLAAFFCLASFLPSVAQPEPVEYYWSSGLGGRAIVLGLPSGMYQDMGSSRSWTVELAAVKPIGRDVSFVAGGRFGENKLSFNGMFSESGEGLKLTSATGHYLYPRVEYNFLQGFLGMRRSFGFGDVRSTPASTYLEGGITGGYNFLGMYSYAAGNARHSIFTGHINPFSMGAEASFGVRWGHKRPGVGWVVPVGLKFSANYQVNPVFRDNSLARPLCFMVRLE